MNRIKDSLTVAIKCYISHSVGDIIIIMTLSCTYVYILNPYSYLKKTTRHCMSSILATTPVDTEL